MASVSSNPGGRRQIQFNSGDGKRRTVRLGKLPLKQAESFKLRVEALIACSITGSVDDETARWLAGLDEAVYAKLVAVGLVKPRNRHSQSLKPFLDAYIADRTDAKPRTIINLKAARKDILAFFGANKPLREITEAEADEFWRYLLRRGLNQNTARRICGRAKQFFRVAAKKRLISSNPFAGVKSHVGSSDPEREFFVTREMIEAVLKKCPDAQWKVIVALSRYGGLRCPSEHVELRWEDVDWEASKITVRSPKTEHHEGKESRVIPLFPELRPYLLEAFEAADPGTVHVVTRFRDGGINMRTGFEKIIWRAKLEPWPKLFHNLRASRQTELAELYPLHVVCAWIGNSEVVAKKHYLMVKDTHFAQALSEPPLIRLNAAGAETGEATQNPTQYPPAPARNRPETTEADASQSPILSGVGDFASAPADSEYPQGGSNTPQNPREKQGVGEKATHFPTHSQLLDADLRALVQVWPSLPDGVRASIITVIQTGRG